MARSVNRRAILYPIAILGVVFFLWVLQSRKAPTPPAFASSITLDAALAESQESGRPVFVFATAEWCGPCKSLKRGALADTQVNAWISANTVPVLLDDAVAKKQIHELGITHYPTLMVVRADSPNRALSGVVTKAALMEFLTEQVAGSVSVVD